MKNKNNLLTCPYCGGKGHVEKAIFLPATRMQKLMKKYGFTQLSLAKILGITQTGVNNWFNPKTNIKGIKKKYFDILKKKGYQ